MPRDKETSYYVFNEAPRKSKGPLPLAVLTEMAEVQAINPETLVANEEEFTTESRNPLIDHAFLI